MSLPWIPAFRRKRAAGDNAYLPISYQLMFCSSRASRRRRRSPVDPVSAMCVASKDARNLRDGSRDPEHRQRTLVRPEPGGTSRGTAHPVVVPKDRAVAFDINLETAVIEVPRVGVRRKLHKDRERDGPLLELPECREVGRLAPPQPANRSVSSVAAPSSAR